MRVEREGKGWMKIEIDREVGWTSMQPTPPQNQEGRLQCLRAPEAPGTEPLFSFPLRTSLTLFAHNNALSFMSHSWVIGQSPLRLSPTSNSITPFHIPHWNQSSTPWTPHSPFIYRSPSSAHLKTAGRPMLFQHPFQAHRLSLSLFKSIHLPLKYSLGLAAGATEKCDLPIKFWLLNNEMNILF